MKSPDANNANSEEEKIEIIDQYLCELKKDYCDNRKAENEIQVNVGNPREYIDSVMVSPWTKEWLVELVKDICEANNLIFAGKSNLLTPVNEHNISAE